MVLLKHLVLIAGIASLTECTPYSKRETDPLPEAYAVADPDAYAEALSEPYLPFSEASLAVRDPGVRQTLGYAAQRLGNLMSKAHPFEGMGQAIEACFNNKLEQERTKSPRDDTNQGSATTLPGFPTAQSSVNKRGRLRETIGNTVKSVGDLMLNPGSFGRLEKGIEACVKQQVDDRTKARRDMSAILVNLARRDTPAPGPAFAAPNSDPNPSLSPVPGSTPDSSSPSGQGPATSSASATSTPSPSPPKSDGLIQEIRDLTHEIEKFLLNPQNSTFTGLLKTFEPELKQLFKALLKVFKFIPFKRDAYANPFPESYLEPSSNLYARDAEADSEIYDNIFTRDAFAEAEAEAEPESEPEPYKAGLYERDAEAYHVPLSGMYGNGRPSVNFQGLLSSPYGGPHRYVPS